MCNTKAVIFFTQAKVHHTNSLIRGVPYKIVAILLIIKCKSSYTSESLYFINTKAVIKRKQEENKIEIFLSSFFLTLTENALALVFAIPYCCKVS